MSTAEESRFLNTAPVLQAVRSIAVPMLVMMLTNIGFSYLDIFYVARLGDEALNAVDICFPLVNLCSAVVYGGLGTGVSAAVSRRHAVGDDKASESSLKAGFLIAVPLSLLFTLPIIFGKSFLFSEAKSPAAREMAYDYCFWYFLFIILMALGAVASSAMRGSGNAKRPAFYSLICMAANAILTPIFCFSELHIGSLELGSGLGMGVKGAAISTVIAYTLFSMMLFYDLLTSKDGLKLSGFTFKIDKAIFSKILNASFIAALMPMMTNIVILFVLKFMSKRSDAMLDAFSLAKRFELYLIQLSVCLGAGAMVVIGASHATGNFERGKEAFRVSLKVLFSFAVPVVLFMFFGSQLYYMTLTENQQIITEGQQYFVWGSLNSLFLCGIIILNFCFQGLGRPALPLPFTLFSVLVIQGLGAALIIPNGYSPNIYYGLCSVGSLLTFLLVRKVFLRAVNEE